MPPINTINMVTYTPPHTKQDEYNEILVNKEEMLKPVLVWSGDFNFHVIHQEERGAEYGSSYQHESINDGSADEREPLKRDTEAMWGVPPAAGNHGHDAPLSTEACRSSHVQLYNDKPFRSWHYGRNCCGQYGNG